MNERFQLLCLQVVAIAVGAFAGTVAVLAPMIADLAVLGDPGEFAPCHPVILRFPLAAWAGADGASTGEAEPGRGEEHCTPQPLISGFPLPENRAHPWPNASV